MSVKHRLVITSRTARTACGIRIAAHYPMSGQALPVDSDEKIECVTSADDSIDCPKCLAAQKLDRML